MLFSQKFLKVFNNNMEVMTNSEKTQCVRIALGLAGIVTSDKGSEIIWRVYEQIQKKKGNFSIKDAVEIENDIQKRQLRSERKKRVSFKKDYNI
jgi:hypothetical protein